MSRRDIGKLGEDFCGHILAAKGYRILAQNYHSRYGEIDLIVQKEGIIAFVEVKAPNQKPRPLQLSRHRLLRRLGFQVYVLDALEDIDKIILEVKNDGTT